MDVITLIANAAVVGILSYLIYLHRSVKHIDDRVDLVYTKQETEHLIDLKLRPLSERTVMLEERLERLERKIDRILEAVGKHA